MATQQIAVRQPKPRKRNRGPTSDYGKWIAKKRAEEVAKFGGRCQMCGNDTYEELEFAHVIETELTGICDGRGSYNRYRDVRDHPECYRLLCYLCHDVFDHERDDPKVQAIYKEMLHLA